MNYRAVFFIACLILIVGISGLWFRSSEEQPQVQSVDSTGQPVEQKPQKLITVAQLKRDVAKGTLLQVEDYSLSELNVVEDNPLVSNDLKAIIDSSTSGSLQGFLMAENVKAESIITPSMIISPTDPKFLISSLDPKQEVAYRIYVKAPECYILDTIRSGGYVSIYNQYTMNGANAERMDLVKISNNLLVLQVQTFSQNNENNTGSANDDYSREYVGYINVKMNAEQVKDFYALSKDAKLIVLPSDDTSVSQHTEHRGIFIRKLRGQ